MYVILWIQKCSLFANSIMQSLLKPRLSSPLRSAALWRLLGTALASALPIPLSGATILYQWNFNTIVTADSLKPTVDNAPGTATIAGYGVAAPSTAVSSVIYNGSPIDPGTTQRSAITNTDHTFNRSLTVFPPLVSALNVSSGVQFNTPTTGMVSGDAVQLSWSQTIGFRSSRFWQLLVSTDGTKFSAPSLGTGSTITQSITGRDSANAIITGNATVTVSSTGLIDFRTINGNWLSSAVTTSSADKTAVVDYGWINGITYTLPTGMGYENNANFKFALVGAWDPALAALNGATGTNSLVSSFSGLASTDTVTGYNRSVASGGLMRLDLMTVSALSPSTPGVPESSSTLALTLSGLGAALLPIWQRRRR